MNKSAQKNGIFLKCPSCGAMNRLSVLNKNVQVTCGRCGAHFMHQPTQQASHNSQKKHGLAIAVIAFVMFSVVLSFVIPNSNRSADNNTTYYNSYSGTAGNTNSKQYSASQLVGEWWRTDKDTYTRPYFTFYENGTCLAYFSQYSGTFTVLSDNTLQITKNYNGEMRIFHIDRLYGDTLIIDGEKYSRVKPG